LAERRQLLPVDEESVREWYEMLPEERAKLNGRILDRRAIKFAGLRRGSMKRDLGQLGAFHVVFFHIPKTGGTTLEYLLAKNYRVDSLQHINAPELDANPYRVCRGGRLARVLMGHYEMNEVFYQWFNRRVAHITMLREPVRRALSYYDYIQTSTGHPLYPVAKDMSLEDFVTSDHVDEQNNAQTHRLLGWLRQGAYRRLDKSEDERFELAKHALEKHFTLVGVTEEYEAFLLQAQSMLRWSDIFFARKNVSRKKTKITDVPEKTLDIIRERNAVDIRVWKHARHLSRRRCEILGIDDAAIEDFKSRNARYLEMIRQDSRDLRPAKVDNEQS
jgi:hypothetical protein